LEKEENNILKAYNMLFYFAGTMIMWDPSIECINDFWNQEIIKKLPVSSRNPRFIMAVSQLRESADDRNSGIEMMKKDFTRLFSVENSGEAIAPPIETRIRRLSTRMQIKAVPPVTEFYSSYGWNSKFRNIFPDDHLGVELLFLTLLIEKYTELDDEACNIEMRGEIRRYLTQHILTWIPEWNTFVQENAKTKSYKGIATLIQACVEDIFSMMEGSLMKMNTYISLN
jgi:putative dimethyl sulfoxide reductase chaperone